MQRQWIKEKMYLKNVYKHLNDTRKVKIKIKYWTKYWTTKYKTKDSRTEWNERKKMNWNTIKSFNLIKDRFIIIWFIEMVTITIDFRLIIISLVKYTKKLQNRTLTMRWELKE